MEEGWLQVGSSQFNEKFLLLQDTTVNDIDLQLVFGETHDCISKNKCAVLLIIQELGNKYYTSPYVIT